jgi:hypothetical protein
VTLRLRLEGDAASLHAFAERHGYPLDTGGWTAPLLQENSIMVRIEAEDGWTTAGYIWGTWAFLPGVLDIHACIAPEFRGRWLDKDMWSQLRWLARFVGAYMLTTRAIGDRPSRLVAAFLQRRLGWKCDEAGRLFTRID